MSSTLTVAESTPMAEDFLEYINATPTPFQLVDQSVRRFKEAGYVELQETQPWGTNKLVQAGGKYFFTRNKSTLVAFTVGGKFEPGGGFKVVGAHTDSPVLKVKPVSKRSASGYLQASLSCAHVPPCCMSR